MYLRCRSSAFSASPTLVESRHSSSPHFHPPFAALQFLHPNMSKSPKDSTRFTATGVWAHPRSGRTTTLNAAPAPKNETPQQKVKRLREAANRAKMAQVTTWDWIYLYGRLAADAAHRFTVYGIIFSTGMVPSIDQAQLHWNGYGFDSATKLVVNAFQVASVSSPYFQ